MCEIIYTTHWFKKRKNSWAKTHNPKKKTTNNLHKIQEKKGL